MNTKVKYCMLSTESPVGVQILLRVLVGSMFILVHSAPAEWIPCAVEKVKNLGGRDWKLENGENGGGVESLKYY